MALQSHHMDPNSHKMEEHEIEVTLDADQEESDVAAEEGSFGKGSVNGADKLKYQGILDDDDDDDDDDNMVCIGDVKCITNGIKDECHGSHPGSKDPQLEEQKNLAAARVPQVWRTRPRIQWGLTPRQLSELEHFFKRSKYPDMITRRNLAKHLYLAEHRVKRWFKRRRARYRKEQQSQMLTSASADTQNDLQ